MANATEVVSTSSPGFRKDFVVSDKATLGFSLDGSHLFLGAAPSPEPDKSPDEEIPAEHYKAVAEVIGYVMRLSQPRRN